MVDYGFSDLSDPVFTPSPQARRDGVGLNNERINLHHGMRFDEPITES